jgi:hypothetical protein
VNFENTEIKRNKTIEALKSEDCKWIYRFDQIDFKRIIGSPIGYWLSEIAISAFNNGTALNEKSNIRQGLATGNNDFFIRVWHEIAWDKTKVDSNILSEALSSQKKWFPYNKGGEYRKWYGNLDYVLAFDESNYELLSKSGNKLPSKEFYFQKAITWTAIASSNFSARVHITGAIFSNAGMVCITDTSNFDYIIGYLNSNVIKHYLQVLSPTLNFNAGDIKKLPLIYG